MAEIFAAFKHFGFPSGVAELVNVSVVACQKKSDK